MKKSFLLLACLLIVSVLILGAISVGCGGEEDYTAAAARPFDPPLWEPPEQDYSDILVDQTAVSCVAMVLGKSEADVKAAFQKAIGIVGTLSYEEGNAQEWFSVFAPELGLNASTTMDLVLAECEDEIDYHAGL